MCFSMLFMVCFYFTCIDTAFLVWTRWTVDWTTHLMCSYQSLYTKTVTVNRNYYISAVNMSVPILQDWCSVVCKNVWDCGKCVWFNCKCVCEGKAQCLLNLVLKNLLFNECPSWRAVGKQLRRNYLLCSYLIRWKSDFEIWNVTCYNVMSK